MNRIATGLLALTAVLLAGFGIERIIFWVSRPLGPQFGAGEMVGTGIGVLILAWGVGLGVAARAVWRDQRGGWIAVALSATALILLAYIALSTPGRAPVPVPLSVGAGLIGLALGGLTIGRAAGRLAP